MIDQASRKRTRIIDDEDSDDGYYAARTGSQGPRAPTNDEAYMAVDAAASTDVRMAESEPPSSMSTGQFSAGTAEPGSQDLRGPANDEFPSPTTSGQFLAGASSGDVAPDSAGHGQQAHAALATVRRSQAPSGPAGQGQVSAQFEGALATSPDQVGRSQDPGEMPGGRGLEGSRVAEHCSPGLDDPPLAECDQGPKSSLSPGKGPGGSVGSGDGLGDGRESPGDGLGDGRGGAPDPTGSAGDYGPEGRPGEASQGRESSGGLGSDRSVDPGSWSAPDWQAAAPDEGRGREDSGGMSEEDFSDEELDEDESDGELLSDPEDELKDEPEDSEDPADSPEESDEAPAAEEVSHTRRNKADYEHNIQHNYAEPKVKCPGVELNERVLLPNGETKLMGDLQPGDLLLDRLGEKRRVMMVKKNLKGDAYRITKNSMSHRFDIRGRQQAIIGAQQNLDVTMDETVRWCPEAWEMVLYEGSDIIDRTDIPDHVAANNQLMRKCRSRKHNMTVPTGVLRHSLDSCDARRRFEFKARRLTASQLEKVWYLAGAWAGDGIMRHLKIAVDSIDKESILCFAQYASDLGLFCDLEYRYFSPDWRRKFQNYAENIDTIRINLSIPSGITAKGLEELDLMQQCISEKKHNADNWRRKHDSKLPEDPEYRRKAALICIYDGYDNDGKRMIRKSWLWKLLMAAQVKDTIQKNGRALFAKSAPKWLVTVPVEWRESFLAGLTESDGTRSIRRRTYRITTIYADLCNTVAAVCQSLGIAAVVTFVEKEGRSHEKYIISLTGGKTLRSTMMRLASPRKKPMEWPSEGACDADSMAFAITPLGKQLDFVVIEIEGHEFQLANGLVMLDVTAKDSFEVLDPKFAPPRHPRYPWQTDDRCISCDRSKSGSFMLSWDIEKGDLCEPCSKKFRENGGYYCEDCLLVPTPAQKKKGKCIKCSGKFVHAQRAKPEMCYSCGQKETHTWCRGFMPENGRMCSKCFGRYKESLQYCPKCLFPPDFTKYTFTKEDRGVKTEECKREGCDHVYTVVVNPCVDCGIYVHGRMRTREGRRLCLNCSRRRLKKTNVN